MENHDEYGKRVVAAAAGRYYDRSQFVRVDYGGSLRTGGFIDATVAGSIAVEVESRTSKQIRGAVLDLLCHAFPKKLLLVLRVHASNPNLAAEQCENALRRFVRPSDYRVRVLDGHGGNEHFEADVAAVRSALIELGMPSDHEAPVAASSEAVTIIVERTGNVGTVIDRIERFLQERSPDAVCDDCIAQRLGLSARQHANQEARRLASESGFSRAHGRCSLCFGDKLVTSSQKAHSE
ncbi:MAG TPA: hypothetical protein VMS32_07235 [Verrucomicrobiae bacterium]|jgi:hypothetical protein|nr:hypothetical protein [Verrucomicrobiae bacterium]